MSKDEALEPGETTTEYKRNFWVVIINIALPIIAALLEKWGITIEKEVLMTAILGNSGATATYIHGRGKLKQAALK